MSWQGRMDQVTAAFVAAHAPTRRTIRLGEFELDVLVAETPSQWKAGMRSRVDDVDGMLFVMPSGSYTEFHMAGIDQPLGIAVFDDEGRLLDVGYMEARTGRYRPSRSFTFALEFTDPAVVAHLGLPLQVAA